MSYRDLFDCTHPILCLPMNGVSDIKLAIAVSQAGCFPSLVMARYHSEFGGRFNQPAFDSDMAQFIRATKTNRIMISMTDAFILQNFDKALQIIKLYRITHIEVIPVINPNGYAALVAALSKIKSLGTKIIVKTLGIPFDPAIDVLFREEIISAAIIKSKLGAGRMAQTRMDTFDFIKYFKIKYPNFDVIASGGIATADDINRCLELGATAVGLGTVFAISEESCIDRDVKIQLTQKTSSDIQLMDTSNLKQNGIIFSKYNGVDNENNSRSLELGVNGFGGHVFVGHGIRHINEVLPVAEIVNRLTSHTNMV
jgi:NAD(P)H-dependent flavin oxidoreductase YrpB (nitropropane dioxygenase family)